MRGNSMAKTLTVEPGTLQQDETKKQRKKQAKQEAKAMLKVELAKKDVGKAQKKLTRAQSNLDESLTHLHKLEERLQQIRTPAEVQPEATQAPSEVPEEVQPETVQTLEGFEEVQPETVQTSEVSDEAYQEPLLISDSTPPQTDAEAEHVETTTDSAPVSSFFEEQPLTQAELDVASYPSDEHDAPSPEAIMETDTTAPENTAANGNGTFSPDEAHTLVEHSNEEPELSNNPNAF